MLLTQETIKTLIAKPKHYGTRGTAKHIFESYLHNRKQFVALDNESRMYTSNWGVPQGSTLGPLLIFNLHQLLDQLLISNTSIACS